MPITGTNLIGVLLGAIAGFAFGAAYYTLLSKHWLDAIGKSEEDVKDTRSAVPFVTSFVSLVAMGLVLSWYFAQQDSGGVSSVQAIHSAIMLWLGLIVTSMATNNAFQGAKTKLTVVDSAHWLGVVVIEALIIARF